MSFIWMKDFNAGLDRRRMVATTPAGALIVATDCHVTRGGEIEKRAAFVDTAYDLPAGTVGFASTRDSLYVFGSAATPVGMPEGVTYQRLQAPVGTPTLSEIVSYDTYNGKLYVVGRFSNGREYHFYDGTVVADWNNGLGVTSVVDNATIAQALAGQIQTGMPGYTATAAGTTIHIAGPTSTNYTLTSGAVNGGATNDQTAIATVIQAAASPVVGTPEVRAKVKITVTTAYNVGVGPDLNSIIINGVTICPSYAFPNNNKTTIAQIITSIINGGTGTHGYTATSADAAITITAPVGSGAAANAYTVAISDNVYLNFAAADYGRALAGGVTAVGASAGLPKLVDVVIGGTFEAGDVFTITVAGVPFVLTVGTGVFGTYVRTIRAKMFAAASSYVFSSKVGDATEWSDAAQPGVGNVNMATHASNSDKMVGLIPYQNYVAVFGEDVVQIWSMVSDWDDSVQIQVLDNTGTKAPRSIVKFGDADVFYLDETGIRSLRARDSSNAAFASDIGNAIDDLVLETMQINTQDDVAAAVGVIEASSGRYWLAINNTIFVFTYFTSSKISAWTQYYPGFVVDHMLSFQKRVFIRTGNKIYVYGSMPGVSEITYDETQAVVCSAYMDGNAPSTTKQFQGVDMAVQGTWDVYARLNPNDEDAQDLVATVAETTYTAGNLPYEAESTHISMKFISKGSAAAKLGSFICHYEGEEDSEG